MLLYASVLLTAAVMCVVLFKRLGLGAMLGYLAAGIMVGPDGFGVVADVEAVLHFSELGVVLLLFVIGLELQPSRLWALRSAVFGFGGAQLLLTAAVITALALHFGLELKVALVTALALALSSTAFVMQLLSERQEMGSLHGQRAFGVLLLQDLAVIPMLAVIPLLALQPQAGGAYNGSKALIALLAVVAVVLGGRFLLRPLLRLLAATEVSEIFTAAALLLVLATAQLMGAVGLSMSLGAFLAGVLLADSEYRHELQADIEPFKGLLLGLFFMAVGMSADLQLILQRPLQILGLVAALVLIKFAVVYLLARIASMAHAGALSLAVVLSQGGEFAFVLFTAAVSAQIMPDELKQTLIVVVTVSMVTTPLLYGLVVRLRRQEEPPPYDDITTQATPVVIAGFGPSGQIIGRILRTRRISFTVLENNWQQVEFVRRFGVPVFFSDARRLEVLRAAHVDKARMMVVAIPNLETSLRIVETVHRHFPGVRVMAMARDRHHALALMEAGATKVIRRTLLSAMSMSRAVLLELGFDESDADRTIEVFRDHDDRTLMRQLALFHDEESLIQDARQAAAELEQLFESDQVQADLPPPSRSVSVPQHGGRA